LLLRYRARNRPRTRAATFVGPRLVLRQYSCVVGTAYMRADDLDEHSRCPPASRRHPISRSRPSLSQPRYRWRLKWHEGDPVTRVAFVEVLLVRVGRVVARRRWIRTERADLSQLRIVVCALNASRASEYGVSVPSRPATFARFGLSGRMA
jgi:hypothetical protein